MTLPSIAEMCSSLSRDLQPAAGFTAPTTEISAVHVSELSDPTSYLSGGELLLTTGLSLPDNAIGCDRYVSRLKEAGVNALGIGLGPSLSAVPEQLAQSCHKHDLCLLVIPPATAFLTITKAYWTARSRSTEQELSDAITAHRSLVNAMVSGDPVGQTLRTLSTSIGAWVATLDSTGGVEQVYPSGRVRDAQLVAEQIDQLQLAGIHSAATFPAGDEFVVVFPLPLEERVVGYIAVGSTNRLGQTDRRLVLTASALLSLDAVQRQRVDAARQAHLHDVSSLIDMGHLEAARRLASRHELPPIGDSSRVLVVQSAKSAEIIDLVGRWCAGSVSAMPERDQQWFVVPHDHPPAGALAKVLARIDPQARAMLSDVIPIDTVHSVRLGLQSLIGTTPTGLTTAPRRTELTVDGLEQAVQRLLGHTRTDLVGTLAAYLRHRGQWDPAARELQVHRNTLRHRMSKVRELMAVDLDDADVTAELWLYLRRNGLV